MEDYDFEKDLNIISEETKIEQENFKSSNVDIGVLHDEDYYLKIIDNFKKLSESSNMLFGKFLAQSYCALGCYYDTENNEKAEWAYLLSLKEFANVNFNDLGDLILDCSIACHNLIAYYYRNKKIKKDAIYYFYLIADKIENLIDSNICFPKKDFADNYKNMGVLLCNHGLYEHARKFFYEAMFIYKKFDKYWDGIIKCISCIGYSFFCIEDYKNALKYYKEMVKIIKKNNLANKYNRYLFHAYYKMYKIYKKQGKNVQQSKYFKKMKYEAKFLNESNLI